MSTSVPQINQTGGLTSTSTLTNGGANGALQVLGLSTGLNTNEIIQAEMAGQEEPLTALKEEISGMQTQDTTLSNIQSSVQGVSLDAMMLGEPSLFFQVQPITSSSPNLVTAQTANGPGAPIGSSTVTVTSLASAAQASFAFTSPTSGTDTLSISDGVNQAETLDVAAGSTAQQVADQINSSNTLTVWASVNQSGQLVLSSRSTGSNYTITAQDTTSAANLVQKGSVAGQDAQYTVNGVAGTSHSDTVTGAIPGVTLNLLGVTPTGSPVTVTVPPPGPDAQGIISAVNQFVQDYNSMISSVQGTINTPPASESSPGTFDPNSGSLFGDPDLENLLSGLRSTMYTPGSGLPSGMAALSDIGISTGASSGSVSQSAVSGQLKVNTTELTAAIQSNPSGVEAILQQWSQSFQTLANAQSSAGGAIAARINGNSTLISSLQSQYSSMNELLQQQQQNLEEQWAQIEGVLSQLHSQTTSLTAVTSAWSQSSPSG